MSHSRVTEADLHAYVDGRLPVRRCLDIENYLATRPDEAVRMFIYQTQKREIQLFTSAAMDDAVPPYLIESATRGACTQPRRWAWVVIFAIAGLMTLGGLLGWTIKGALRGGSCNEAVWRTVDPAWISPGLAPASGAIPLRSSTDRLAG